MKERVVYLTHWRFPSEKTMTPLIMKTCVGFAREGMDAELWIPKRHNPEFEGVDPFVKHGIPEQFRIRRIPAIDLMRFIGPLGFLLLVISFNISAYLMLWGKRHEKGLYLYAHDIRDVLLPCLLGLPTFVEIHDFYESSMRWMNEMVFRHSNGLIVTNTIKKKYINESYGYPLENMLHQQNAVEYDFFHISVGKEEARARLGLPLDRKIALYTGHLFSWKGVDTLALAALSLPEDVYVYFVGGTPGDREVLQKFVADHQAPRIEFFPHQEHAQIPYFFKAADVLILPNTAKEAASKFETSPVKLFEYMSSEVPIVASDLPSIRDIVDDNEVWYFEPDNPESLSAAVAQVFANPAEAVTKSQTASAHAKNLSWEARGAAIAALIHRTTPPVTSVA
jgi:glycosyltransferase involved in cell wall biosynthesis